MLNKYRLISIIVFFLLTDISLQASSLSSPITNRPDPFGPLPSNSRTTNIFWINRSGYVDYVDIIYKSTSIMRRLNNQNTAAGTGNIRITNIWNGTNDSTAQCVSGTYDAKIKVSRIATYDSKVPPSGDYTEFMEPRDLACDKLGNVYVLDRTLQTVQKFSTDGALIWKYTFATGTANGQVNFSTIQVGGLTVDTNYYFYIADQGASRGRIQQFDQSGNWVATIGGSATFDNGDDDFSGLGYDKNNGEVFTTSLASEDMMRVICSSMSLGNQQTRLANGTDIKDVAIANNGDVYGVTGTTIRRITRANFTGNGNSWITYNTTLADAMSITVRSNYLYVAGAGANQIRKHSLVGVALETRGSFGYGNTNFWSPSGIAWDSKNDLIWVSDTSNQRLVCYSIDSSGNLVYSKKIETSPYSLRNPLDIALDEDANIFIVDNGHCKIKKFDQFGNYLMEFGGRGYGNGKFIDPRGIAVDDAGFLYVSDYGTGNGSDAEDQIERFNSSGTFISATNHTDGRGMASFNRNGTNYIIAIGQNDGATADNTIRVYNTNFRVIQTFRDGTYNYDYMDLDRDFSGRFYCVDAVPPAWVYSYASTASGSTAPTIDSIGGTRAGLAIDSYGSLWIPDQGSDDCEVRQTYAVGVPTTLLYSFGSLGSSDGQFNNPAGAAIRLRELPYAWAHFWVVDSGNNRVEKFIINWSDEVTEPVTISTIGSPTVTAAYPDTSSSNTRYIDGVYYSRAGKTTFKVYFSQNMNTNIKPTIQYVTADNYTYDINRTSFMGNVWTGTAWIATGHDGSADIKVENAQNTFGSNLNPNPTVVNDTFVIDTIAPSINILNPLDGTVTTLTNILIDGSTEAEIRVDVFNWSSLTGGTLISSKSNINTDGTGYYMYNTLKLKTPKDSTNYLTAQARDKAGNWSSEHSPRHLVRCIDAIGYAYVEPSTNRRLGDKGSPPIIFTWQANADMVNTTVTVDVPSGWSPPSTNRGSAGYVRLQSYSGISFTTGKTLWTSPSYPGRFKVNCNSINSGGYFKITYGTNALTMVSNSYSTAIGLNEWVARATNATTQFTNIWLPPKKVSEALGKSMKIAVKGKALKVSYTNIIPTQTYRGASDVSAIRILFINSNNFHSDQVNSFVLNTENAAQQQVNANTRLSSVTLYTSGNFYLGPFSVGASPQINFDLTSSPLIVAGKKTNRLDVRMNILNTTTATDIRFSIGSKNDIMAKNYLNYPSVDIDVTGNFPIRTTYAVIRSNLPVRRMNTGRSNFMPGWVDIKQKNVNAMQVILFNTNNQVNDIEVLQMNIKVENDINGGLIPNSVIDKVVLQKKNSGPIYAQKTPVESTGDTIYLNVSSLYIPQRTSITCDYKVDIKTNVSATNFQLNISARTNIKARDKIMYNTVTNFAYTGYSFPMRTGYAEIAHHFQITHKTNAIIDTWSPVNVRVLNVSNRLVRRYGGGIALDTDGTATAISWTNNYVYAGIFLDGGALSDTATYQFNPSDNGMVTLSIKDTLVESVNISVTDVYIRDNNLEGNLNFIGRPNIKVSKSVFPLTARPFETLTYTFIYSNASLYPALNFAMIENMPTNTIYITNSAEISNTPHAGTANIYYSTNRTNAVWYNNNFDNATNRMKIQRIRWILTSPVNSAQTGILKFKAIIK